MLLRWIFGVVVDALVVDDLVGVVEVKDSTNPLSFRSMVCPCKSGDSSGS